MPQTLGVPAGTNAVYNVDTDTVWRTAVPACSTPRDTRQLAIARKGLFNERLTDRPGMAKAQTPLLNNRTPH